jgi:hypothetical protein
MIPGRLVHHQSLPVLNPFLRLPTCPRSFLKKAPQGKIDQDKVTIYGPNAASYTGELQGKMLAWRPPISFPRKQA